MNRGQNAFPFSIKFAPHEVFSVIAPSHIMDTAVVGAKVGTIYETMVDLPSLPVLQKRPQAIASSSFHSELSCEKPVSERMESPTAPINEPDSTLEKTPQQKIRGRLHLAALFLAFFLSGWTDGSAGPLIPLMQRDYRVGFTLVSLIFVINSVGFLTGAIMNVWLLDRFGFGKVVVLGAVSQIIAYAIQCPAPPFPVFVLSYFFSGFGISLQDAGGNGFVGGLPKDIQATIGCLHACYGFGAFASPLVATHFSNTKNWSYHYLTSMGMALINITSLSLVFRFKRQEEIYTSSGDYRAPSEAVDSSNKYGQIVKIKSLHLLALCAFLYVGVQVTLGGWIVTFIIQERHGGKDAGYISSGFYGGLALGRILLIWLNLKVGGHVVYIYSVIIIALEITIWFVPSLIQNAIAVSFVGVVLGPMHPIIVNQAKALLPRWLLSGCVGWISAVSMAGSAALPFFTGVLATKFGIRSLQPLIVSMMSVLIGVWLFVPKLRRVE